MKYMAIIDEETLSDFRIDEAPYYMSSNDIVLVVNDKLGFSRGIPLRPITDYNKITIWLIEYVFRNEKYYTLHDEDTLNNMIWDLMEIIASLHNEYFRLATGEYYDYMFHWVNKMNCGSIKDDIFK